MRVHGPAGGYFISNSNLIFISNSNLIGVPPSLTPGAPVSRGQVIGIAGTLGDGRDGAFALSHFQVADPEEHTPGLSTTGR